MGKSLLLIVGAVALATGSLVLSGSRDHLGRADLTLSNRGSEVIAQQIAHSGAAEAEGRLLPALVTTGLYTGARMIDGRHQGGSYRVVITEGGLPTAPLFTIRSEGRFAGGTAVVARSYRLEVVGGVVFNPPPFMQEGGLIEGNLQIRHDFNARAENPARNVSIRTNGNLEVTGGQAAIGGFGSYTGNLVLSNGQTAAQVFQPPSNPTNAPVHARVARLDVQGFTASDHRGRATRTTSGDLALSGTVALGTRAAPTVWYVDGNIRTTGDVAFTGYGVFITPGSVEIYHNVRSGSGLDGESTLGIYAQGNINVLAGSLTVTGQLYTGANLFTRSPAHIVGSFAVRGNLQTEGPFGLTYRPASEALTRPFWASSQQVAPVSRRVIAVSRREW